MAETNDLDHHLIEIPDSVDHHKKLISAIAAVQDHPLMEISDSPGHLLLLKLLQREEDLSGRRIARKETRLDTLRREVFQLCLFFFAFHGLFLTILFGSYNNNDSGVSSSVCGKWWVPMISSLAFCVVMVVLVQMKLYGYWKVNGEIQREKSDNRGLTRCIQELRMKGVSFDLSKEPGNGKRMKSSSVEIKWRPVEWCRRYCVTIGLVLVSGLVLPVCKLMVCS